MAQDGEPKIVGKAKRYHFDSAGTKFATVDLFLNQDGTTTISHKIGNNQELGEQLAAYLNATINPAEFESVNPSIKGIRGDDFDSVIGCINDSGEFEIEANRDEPACKQITLRCIAHQDQLKLTSHKEYANTGQAFVLLSTCNFHANRSLGSKSTGPSSLQKRR